MLNTDTLIMCSGNPVGLNLFSNTLSLAPHWNCITTTSTIQTPSTAVQQSSTINDFLVNPETYTQEIIYSVNFIGTPGNPGNDCPGSASNVHVFVVPRPTIQPINDQVLCPNVGINPLPVNINIPNSTLTWSMTGDNIGLPFVTNNSILSSQLIPGYTTANNQQTDQLLYISLNPSYTYTIPNTNLSETCLGNSELFNIVVKPIPHMLDQNLAAICSELNLNVPFNASNNGVPGINSNTGQPLGVVSYNLDALNLNGLSIYGGNVGVTTGLTANDLMDDSYTNTEESIISVIYDVIPVITYPIVNGFLSCEGELFTVTAPINPEPVVANVALTKCSDVELGLILPDDQDDPNVATNGNSIMSIANLGNLTSSGGTPIICNDTNNMVLFDDKWHNISSSAENIVYTIIPEAELTGCAGNPFTVTATINPEPVVDDLYKEVCSKEELTLVNFNTTNGVTPSSFIVNALTPSPGALASLYSGGPILISSPTPPISLSELDFEDDAFQNIGSQINTIHYHISPYSTSGCVGDEFELTLDVKPEPVGVNQSYVYCSDESFGIDLQQQIDNGGNGVESSFVWTLIPPVNGPLTQSTLPANNSATNPAYNPPPHLIGSIENMGQSQGIATYSVVPTSISPFYCAGEPFEVEIKVNPEPVVANVALTKCSDVELGLILPDDQDDPNVATNGYSIMSIANLGNLTSSGGTPIICNDTNNMVLFDDKWHNSSSIPEDIVYTIKPKAELTGCAGNPFTVTALINPIPVMQFSVLNLVNCTNSLIEFSNSSTLGLDYLWDFGDGSVSTEFEPSHEYDFADTFNVVLAGTYPSTGCSSSIADSVIINYLPDPMFNISDNEGCDQLDVTFNAVDLNDDWTYYWDFGNGQGSYQDLFTQNQFTTEGCYDVSLTITTPEGCVSSHTETNAVCMYDTPQASFELDDYVINNLDNDVQVTNNTIDATSYFWDFGDGYTTWDDEPGHAYSDIPSTYVVNLTAYNEIGCLDIASRNLLYWQDLLMYVPNTFTPDGDAYNQEFLPVISAGFKPESYQMQIFNRWGELVFESNNAAFGWDGTYGTNESRKCQQGTYTWVIRLEILQSGENKVYTGHVNLLK
jgi:gliding motility-associated-like protein